jgi:hypothetical protein
MTKWLDISSAPQLAGAEIIGTKFVWDGKRMVMVRDPFVSCWSDGAGKFIGSPSHWVECPAAPDRPVDIPKAKKYAPKAAA